MLLVGWHRGLYGLVWGSILNVFYINDIDKYLASNILKFVDDAVILISVSTQEDINKIRSDLILLLGKWSSD